MNAVREILAHAFPGCAADEPVALAGGRSNATYRVRLQGEGDVVVRVYLRKPEAAVVEFAVLERLWDKVPVPEPLYVQPGTGEFPAAIVYRYVEGITFRDLLKTRDAAAIAEASVSVGAALAALDRTGVASPSADFISGAEPASGAGSASGAMLGVLLGARACASSALFEERLGSQTYAEYTRFVDDSIDAFGKDDTPAGLVHGDFSRTNVVVNRTTSGWRVAAIVDWEFAHDGPRAADIGHFLRYERPDNPRIEPHLARGFTEGGGTLPIDWRRLTRLADLARTADGLTKHWSSPGSVDTQLSPSNTGVGVFNVKKTSAAEEAAEVHARVQA
jgi:aminoglycoside phosphotransferase (APT) family kinase protein